MRTTLDLNEKLLEEVVKLTGEKSKSKAVNKQGNRKVLRHDFGEVVACPDYPFTCAIST